MQVKRGWLDTFFDPVGVDKIRWSVKNGKVNGYGSAQLNPGVEKLPFPIESLCGSIYLTAHSSKIKSFENFPKEVSERVQVSYCDHLDDWTNVPSSFELVIFGCKKLTNLPLQLLQHLKDGPDRLQVDSRFITSLAGFDKVKISINDIRLNCGNIEEGGIGLLTIDGLQTLDTSSLTDSAWNCAATIIEKYVGKPDDIYTCQAEILNDEWAKMFDLERFTRI